LAENKEFREARERTASLADPTICLSRQELAELANAWIWEHRKKTVALSANYIGQLERGKIRWPGKFYRDALRAILGVSTDAALGFVNTRRYSKKLEDVRRRKFTHTITGLGIGTLVQGPLAAFLQGSEPTPTPRRVGATDIEQVRTVTRVFESWGCSYGGAPIREAAMGQLRSSASLLNATCSDRLRPELFSAVGDLADMAGYIAVDANVHEEGRRAYRFALACAEEAEDWPLRAEVLSSMAKQAIWTGQPDEGLTLAEHALVRPDRLTPAVRALLHTDRGRALAKMHQINEAFTAIGTADEHFAHVTPDNEPSFAVCYGEARHAQLTGQPLADLAILGSDPGEATNRLAAAAAKHTVSNTRSRAVCLIRLAILTMITGDPLQAAAMGHTALDAAGIVRSRRTAEDLRELAQYAATHQRIDEVAHLIHRIGTLLRRIDSP
jgi:hypothetical protein